MLSEKYKEMRKRVEQFIVNARGYLITAIKPNIETTLLDVAQMVCEIPEEDYPIFQKVLDDLVKEKEAKENGKSK